MPRKDFPPVAAFGVAIIVALLCGWMAIGVSESDATKPHVPVTGTLTKATIIGGPKSRALHLRMDEESVDFRLNPPLFSETMHQRVPDDLRPGARIVWFHGLTIGDREVFGLAQARAWEVENQRSFYVLVALSLLGVVYYGVKWLRSR